MVKIKILPFSNESESACIEGLTIENRVDRISIYGSIDVTRDSEGLSNAEELRDFLGKIVSALKSENLPDRISIEQTEEIPNPFNAATGGNNDGWM